MQLRLMFEPVLSSSTYDDVCPRAFAFTYITSDLDLRLHLCRTNSKSHTHSPFDKIFATTRIKDMVTNTNALVRTLAEICNKIRHGSMRQPQDMLNGEDRNEGNLHEALVMYHDARLALEISNLSPERQRAICVEAGLRYENIEDDPTHPNREDEVHGLGDLVLNSEPLPTTGPQRGYGFGTADTNLFFRLKALGKETQQAIFDVVGMIREGSLELFLGGRRGRQREEEEDGEEDDEAAQPAQQAQQVPQTQQVTQQQESSHHADEGYCSQEDVE